MSSELDDLEELIGPMPTRRRSRLRHRGDAEPNCKRGHPLTGDNIYLEQTAGGTIRHCKKCARLRILCREDS